MKLSDYNQFMRRFSEDFKTVFGDDAKIFQATADFARQIHARFDRDDIANLERSFIARGKHGELMNINAHAMA